MRFWNRKAGAAFAFVVVAVVVWKGTGVSTPNAGRAATEEVWLGVYLGSQKIGYANFITRPTTYKGKPAFVLESVNLIRANLLGQQLEETIVVKQISDAQWAPRQMTFTQKSQGRTSSLVADFFSDRIECKQVTEQRTTDKIVKIPKGVSLIADHQALMQKKTFKRGEKIEFYEFNPAFLTIDKNVLEAVGDEEIEIDGKKIKALAMKHRMALGTGTIETQMWLDKNGEPLKMQSLLMLTFIREPKEKALDLPSGIEKPIDIALATSIKTSTAIENPRQVKYLRLKVSGTEGIKGLPQDSRIRLNATNGKGTLEVTSESYDEKKSVSLPINVYGDLLKDGPYVEANDPAIRKQAKEIVGQEKNAYKAAMKIRDWVHNRIHWQANIGVIRSAVDILKDPAGVCRDAAVLYTALARAAGLPTRIAAGLVYAAAPDAGFFGHAWAETFVGEWVPIDPTLGDGFVDATHLKLAQGEYTCFFDVVQGLGRLQFEVEEVRS